jgi:hypothetical protein
MNQLDGVSTIVLVTIAAFAIERVTKGALFLLTYTRTVPDPELIEGTTARAKAIKRWKLLYFVVAGVLSFAVLAGFGRIRLLMALGVQGNDVLDLLVTGVILLGGSDRISSVLSEAGKRGVAEERSPQSVELIGRLILEDQAAEKVKRAAA